MALKDAYLTTNPEVTFFKVVYKRHTNFAMESMEQTLNGTANFGNKVVCKVSRNGDLMSSHATLKPLSQLLPQHPMHGLTVVIGDSSDKLN